MHRLDFNNVPDLSYTKAFSVIDASVLDAMTKLPETSERARCAVHFSYRIANQTTEDMFRRQGYMRASLAEFVGMEEALLRDLRKLGVSTPPLKANSGTKPLLHIIRELRNFEIHLHSSPLSPEKKSTLWGDFKNPDEAIQLETTIWVIDDLTEARFSKLRNAGRYDPADVSKLVSWFNSAQKEWGVHDLIQRAAEEFCCEMIAEYSL